MGEARHGEDRTVALGEVEAAAARGVAKAMAMNRRRSGHKRSSPRRRRQELGDSGFSSLHAQGLAKLSAAVFRMTKLPAAAIKGSVMLSAAAARGSDGDASHGSAQVLEDAPGSGVLVAAPSISPPRFQHINNRQQHMFIVSDDGTER
ncbi:hypothetical protein E2562_032077 [Oryza meyeriana var. granulata]|uniref:Uncharacterized protein n=1 Tax=Oryza meyeriana var. granulata TaxID=110450 RepID=A0A6G1CJX5_9ORYZ|nr:hypothetical protein E2562_032077 [Oryza meyeriana var. granulata]